MTPTATDSDGETDRRFTPGDRVTVEYIRGDPSPYWKDAYSGTVQAVEGPRYQPAVTIERADTGETTTVTPSGTTGIRHHDPG